MNSGDGQRWRWRRGWCWEDASCCRQRWFQCFICRNSNNNETNQPQQQI